MQLRARVVAAELLLLEREQCFEQRDGLVQSFQPQVTDRQVVHAGEGVGVVGAELGLLQLQRLLVQRQGLVELAGGQVGLRQVVHASEGVGVVGAELGLRSSSVSSSSGRALSSWPASW